MKHFEKYHMGLKGVVLPVVAAVCLFSSIAFGEAPQVVRIGFSSTILGDVNQNDAIAAVRAWALAFADARDISVVPQPLVLNGMGEIREVLGTDTIDYINLATDEYSKVREMVPTDTITIGVVSGSITEEYLLVVSEKSGIEKLGDLRGRSLYLQYNARASLATVWLDTILRKEGLEPAAGFFGDIKPNAKAGKILLPVFFGQVDACVVTRKAFDTMAELNPQIGQRLKVIADSPPIVPTVFCFTQNAENELKERISREITQWHLTPAGKQCLAIFQTDSIEEHPVEILDETMALIAEHEQFLDRRAGGAVVTEK